MKLQPYLRCSTDDKGQDPLRQLNRIQPWASSEGAELLLAVVDEGTSATKTRPFDRPKFLEAVHAAKMAGARGIVVETEDRFSRKGSRSYFAAMSRLEDEHGLKLYTTGMSIETQDSSVGEMFTSIKASLARMDADERRAKTMSGIQRAQEKGVKFGRPRKPFLSIELELARKLRHQGMGWEAVANEINKARGVFDLASPDLQAKRRISPTAVRNALRVAESVQAANSLAPEGSA